MSRSFFSRVGLTAIAAALSLGVACTASVEDRVKTWDRNQKDADTLKTKYPNFAAVIDAQKATATKAWDEAMKISDEEKKAEELGAASANLSKLTNRINEVDSKSKSLSDNITKLAKLKLPKSKAQQRRDAMDVASMKHSNVQKAMLEAQPTNNAEAMQVLDTQVSTLISANNNIERTIKSLKPAPAKKSKKSKKKKK